MSLREIGNGLLSCEGVVLVGGSGNEGPQGAFGAKTPWEPWRWIWGGREEGGALGMRPAGGDLCLLAG